MCWECDDVSVFFFLFYLFLFQKFSFEDIKNKLCCFHLDGFSFEIFHIKKFTFYLFLLVGENDIFIIELIHGNKWFYSIMFFLLFTSMKNESSLIIENVHMMAKDLNEISDVFIHSCYLEMPGYEHFCLFLWKFCYINTWQITVVNIFASWTVLLSNFSHIFFFSQKVLIFVIFIILKALTIMTVIFLYFIFVCFLGDCICMYDTTTTKREDDPLRNFLHYTI